MRFHYGNQGGTGRLILRRLPDGRFYIYIRLGRKFRFTI